MKMYRRVEVLAECQTSCRLGFLNPEPRILNLVLLQIFFVVTVRSIDD